MVASSASVTNSGLPLIAMTIVSGTRYERSVALATALKRSVVTTTVVARRAGFDFFRRCVFGCDSLFFKACAPAQGPQLEQPHSF